MLLYNGQSTAESHFHLYQSVKRARQEMFNLLVNGEEKTSPGDQRNFHYQKESLPIISFGNEMFDEYRTLKYQNIANIKCVTHLHSVLDCTSCGMICQRDVNATKNIFEISQDILGGRGRP
ncbi:uncharacterized protein BX663DRAFT_481779 [Cokeromyces recurvatus]|uniref:uncharacterized protein n=1 Tax=Cokeromyces recurvatus TaxID=90255 RepID=UPI00221E6AE1|nr:uncharacterized protein BX663DRAFT_481779 [Cokeromyces recurvatus]KAI7907440.1 hypothetical protein BX663DRAFT_481779 [Cokeromyces recurvatus]